MATVINTPATREVSSDGAAAGWAVAVVVLVGAILLALFVWPGYVRQSAPAQQAPNINVSLPSSPAPSAPAETGGNVQEAPSGGAAAPAQ